MELLTKTIGACLHERAELTPDRIGLSCRNHTYTWKEIDQISDYLAMDFLQMGMERGDHAAIWGVNSPNWLLHYYGLVKIGVTVILINTCFKARELEDILRDTDVNYLFYGNGCKDTDYRKLMEEVPWAALPKLRKRWPLEKGAEDQWYVRSDFKEYPGADEQRRLRQAESLVRSEDTANILFTSGTTSRPKGVMLSHDNLVNNSMELVRQMHWKETDKFCLAVPLFHCFGITAGILAGLHAGADIHLLKYYKTLEVLKQVEEYQCTVLNGVPTMFLALARNVKKPEYDISSLKSGIIAGSPILVSEYLDVCDSLGMEYLQMSYGQTESSPCITISPYEQDILEKAKSAGRKIPGIELEVQIRGDLADKTGEIITKGYHVMKGYYGKAEETAHTIDEEGWLHTGDLGYIDTEGYLHITGRMKDMIIRGGENISPLEIESCILEMEQVEQVKVVGIPAAILQEEIAACVIPVSGAAIGEAEVQVYVRNRLSDYKVPKYVIACSEFPLNESGKVKTRELRRLAREMIEAKSEGGK